MNGERGTRERPSFSPYYICTLNQTAKTINQSIMINIRNTLLLGIIFAMILIFGSKQIGFDPAPKPGETAPDFTVARNDTAVSLHELHGRYVLVDFWSSSDANSRIKSNEYNTLPLTANGKLQRLSINFDRTRELFNEIVSRDHLDRSEQYFAGDSDAEQLARDYAVGRAYNSYLIDPDGKIIAVNPDNEYLTKYFRMQPALSYR